MIKCIVTVRAEGGGRKWHFNEEAPTTMEALCATLQRDDVRAFFAGRPHAPMCVHVQTLDPVEDQQGA